MNDGSALVAAVVALGALVAGLLVWLVVLSRRLAAARRQFAALGRGVAAGNLEQLLDQHLRRLDGAEQRLAALSDGQSALGESLRGALQRVGLVKYDAFAHVGGEVSFAVALLDADGNGVVLNSLYGREGGTVYAKPVQAGRSLVPLSAEEQRAVDQAFGR